MWLVIGVPVRRGFFHLEQFRSFRQRHVTVAKEHVKEGAVLRGLRDFVGCARGAFLDATANDRISPRYRDRLRTHAALNGICHRVHFARHSHCRFRPAIQTEAESTRRFVVGRAVGSKPVVPVSRSWRPIERWLRAPRVDGESESGTPQAGIRAGDGQIDSQALEPIRVMA